MAYDWVQRFPAHSPIARYEYAMAWDGADVMLFGGVTNTPPTIFDETWTWNGTDWTEESPANNPGPRSHFAMAYDRANDRVVLFGGLTSAGGEPSSAVDETWIWDGNDWTQLTPATSPQARFFHSMTYDEVRGEVVLVGGADNPGGVTINDTWTWDGTDWTQLTPGTQSTGQLPVLAWDQTNGEVVRWGGPPASTWTWDGTDWVSQSPANEPPGPEVTGMTAWRVGGSPLSFGGRTGGFPDLETDETWVWDGSDWTQATPVHSPSPRADITLAYDETRDHVVLFGGLLAGGGPPERGDTWVYADSGPFTLHLET